MSKNRITSFITQISIPLTFIVYISSCASISAPQGGRKDTQAPIIIKTLPENLSLNNKTNRIIITTNEELDITKLKEKIIFSPNNINKFKVDNQGKKLVIKLEDTLKNKETYTIDFQDGLRDNHEGIFIKNYKLTFSTYNKLDAFSIIGKVRDNYTKEPAPNYLVALYKTDSVYNVEKKIPAYKTYTDNNGIFKLQNIKDTTYNIIAFDDNNKNNLLEINKENMSFLLKPIKPAINPDSVFLYSDRNDNKKPKLLTVTNDQENEIQFNEGLFTYKLKSTKKFYHKLSDDFKKIIIYKTDLCEDSIPVKITVTDSSDNDTIYNIKLSQSSPKKFKTHTNIIKSVQPDDKFILTDSLPIKITFEYPIVKDQDSTIICTNDSTSFKYLRLLRDFKANESNTEFTYTYKRRSKEFIELIIKPRAFYTSIGETNKDFIKKYSKPKTIIDLDKADDQYAKVNINTKDQNLIIELLSNKQEILQTDVNTTRLKYQNLKPGKYSIRIIADKNLNKKWDRSNYITKKPSEKIEVYKDILDIRLNWDIEDVNITF